VKKAWYVGPEAAREKIAKWEPKHQPAPTLNPWAEFAAVLRDIGAVVEGEHPIMNGETQRIPARKTGQSGLPKICVSTDVFMWSAHRALLPGRRVAASYFGRLGAAIVC
jgi:hypothetical protein